MVNYYEEAYEFAVKLLEKGLATEISIYQFFRYYYLISGNLYEAIIKVAILCRKCNVVNLY